MAGLIICFHDTTAQRVHIFAHSKALLRESIANDVAFLAEHGGVDYSLLVGVDDEAKEIVIGLIDTLGVFSALKFVEHQLKTGVKRATGGGEVTVLPPSDYAERFKKGTRTQSSVFPVCALAYSCSAQRWKPLSLPCPRSSLLCRVSL